MKVGVLRGCQVEALLPALVLKDVAQQLVGRAHVIAKERARVLCGVAQCPHQLQGPGAVHLRLVAAQLLILEQGGSRNVCKPTSAAFNPCCYSATHYCLVQVSLSERNFKNPKAWLGMVAHACNPSTLGGQGG